MDGNIECGGDQVEVALDAVEDGFSTTVCRVRRPTPSRMAQARKAFEAEEIVVGRINGKVKGGFTVELDQIRTFLPVRAGRCTPGARYLLSGRQGPRIQVISWTRSATTSWSRAVPWLNRNTAKSATSCSTTCRKARKSKGRGQEPHRLRCVRRPRRHRQPAAYHRHGVEARQHPSEVVEIGDDISVKVLKVRSREDARIAAA